ncbi:MAG: ABC transporter permease, partial [Gemmatimonadota bacterium]
MFLSRGLPGGGGWGWAPAVAIGASFYSFVGVMVDPALPLHEGDRVVALQNLDRASGEPARATHLHALATWREELRAVAELGAYRTVDRNVAAPDGGAEPLRVAEMTASGFRIARVPPLLGRPLLEEDERAGAPPVVVIGHDLWRRRFGGRPDAVGRTLRLGAVEHTVVGVMPEGFAFPVNNRVWAPLRLRPADFREGEAPPVEVFGRLAPGATLEQARAQLATLGRRTAAEHPGTHRHLRPRVLPYTHSFIDSPEQAWAFQLIRLAVAMLLVVIAVNVAILVYARTTTRTGEILVRLALGASRARIVAQLFAEALVLALLSAALGLAAAWLALRQVNAYADRVGGEQFPFWQRMGLSPGAVLYAAGLAVLAAVIVGVVPGLKATGRRAQAGLREAGGAAMHMGGTWTALIVAQVAVAVAILPPTADFAWTQLFPGGIAAPDFDASGLLTADLGLDRETPPGGQAESYAREFAARLADRQRELASRLEAEPGAAGVAYVSRLSGGTVEIEGPRPGAAPSRHGTRFLQADPGAFEVYGATLLAGRTFRRTDVAGLATAVVVNRSFVEHFLGGGDALGRRLRYPDARGDVLPGGVEKGGWYEIVGVVDDFPVELPYAWQGVPTLYHAAAPGRLDPATLVVRTRGIAPESLAGRLRGIAAAVDPALRLGEVRPLAERRADEERTRRQSTAAFLAVALSVVLLSAAGIHALVSFTVTRRRKEIGIRAALGARPRHVLASVFARAAAQLGAGVALGGLAGSA